MKPQKFFNFVLPFDIYQELKQLSMDKGESIAALVRQSIGMLLDEIRATKGDNADD